MESGEIAILDPRFIRGDCNFSNNIDLADPIGLASILFVGAPAPPCADACDGNDDGQLDLADVISVLEYLFIQGAAPPPPFPACGLDPTPDATACDFPRCNGVRLPARLPVTVTETPEDRPTT